MIFHKLYDEVVFVSLTKWGLNTNQTIKSEINRMCVHFHLLRKWTVCDHASLRGDQPPQSLVIALFLVEQFLTLWKWLEMSTVESIPKFFSWIKILPVSQLLHTRKPFTLRKVINDGSSMKTPIFVHYNEWKTNCRSVQLQNWV